MIKTRISFYPAILLILLVLSLAPAGGSALAQSPNEINCIPKYNVYLPLVVRSVVISGKVTYQGQPVPGVYLALYRLKSSLEIEQVVQTDAQGNYSFINPAKISRRSKGYAVVFENGKNGNTDDIRFLSGWMSFPITTLDSSTISGGNFDIADIGLSSPESGQTVTIPANFSWARGTAGSVSYTFNLIDDDGTLVFWTDPKLGYVDTYTQPTLPIGVVLGVKYWWNIGVFAPDGGYGASYWKQSIYFGSEAGSNSSVPEDPARNQFSPAR